MSNLINRLSRYSKKCLSDNYDSDFADAVYEAIDVLSEMDQKIAVLEKAKDNAIRELNICRNELCIKCELYKMAHKGACDDCRFKDWGAGGG